MSRFFQIFLCVFAITGCMSESMTTSVSTSRAAIPENPLMKEYCTECHGAPRPDAHVAKQWRNVVYRMQQHRLKRGFDKIPDGDFEALLTYLEQNSKQ